MHFECMHCESVHVYCGMYALNVCILNVRIVSLYMYIVNVCIECMHFECMHCEFIRGMTTKCQKLVFFQGYFRTP